MWKIRKFSIWEIPKNFSFEKYQISKIVQFRKIENFRNFTIWKTIKIP